jgi:hypothetical protein
MTDNDKPAAPVGIVPPSRLEKTVNEGGLHSTECAGTLTGMGPCDCGASAPKNPNQERSRSASTESDLAAPVVLPVVARLRDEVENLISQWMTSEEYCLCCDPETEGLRHEQDKSCPIYDLEQILVRVDAVLVACPGESSDLGLSLDMLDVDRLRKWAENIETYGPDLREWGAGLFIVGKLRDIAEDIETAIKDVGTLRAALALREGTLTHDHEENPAQSGPSKTE